MARRKHYDTTRKFHETWEEEFFFVEYDGQPLCILCDKQRIGMRRSKISRHYNTYHAKICDTYSAQSREELLNSFKVQYESKMQGNHPSTSVCQKESLAVSYSVALEIARAKKCFTDGELIKKCAIEMAKAFNNAIAVKNFENVPLSRHTVSRRITDSNKCIENKLISSLENCKYFSLSVDESTDASDVSQLPIFV